MSYNNKKAYFIKNSDRENLIIYLSLLITDKHKNKFCPKFIIQGIISIHLKGGIETS